MVVLLHLWYRMHYTAVFVFEVLLIFNSQNFMFPPQSTWLSRRTQPTIRFYHTKQKSYNYYSQYYDKCYGSREVCRYNSATYPRPQSYGCYVVRLPTINKEDVGLEMRELGSEIRGHCIKEMGSRLSTCWYSDLAETGRTVFECTLRFENVSDRIFQSFPGCLRFFPKIWEFFNNLNAIEPFSKF